MTRWADAAPSGVRHVLLAVQFYTRVPVRGRLAAWVGYRPEMLPSAAGHLPLVGWLVAGTAAAVGALAWPWWPPLLVAVACTATTVLVTGAFHEDGLADTADGLGGFVPRDRALQIMTDSRLGTYGVITLVLALLAKVAALAQLGAQGAEQLAVALVVAHVVSRLCPLAVMTALPYVGSAAGKAKPMAQDVPARSVVVATAWTAPALVLLVLAAGPTGALLLLAVLAGVVAGAVWWLRRRLEGFTGDTLGAVQQVSELTVYVCLVTAVS